MKLHVKELIDNDLTIREFEKWLTQQRVQPDDVLFFYFTGHGFRTDKSPSIWPNLYLPSKKESLASHSLINKILQKGAGLSIILTDCCNNVLSIGEPLPFFSSLHIKKVRHHKNLLSYKKLFSKSKGVIIASGSRPGKKAYADTFKGGFFTEEFLKSLKSELSKSKPCWRHILKKAKSSCQSLPTPQKPQFQVAVKKA